MTRDQQITVLQLHKLRIQSSETFNEFKKHQLELLNILIADQDSTKAIENALDHFIKYDDEPT